MRNIIRIKGENSYRTELLSHWKLSQATKTDIPKTFNKILCKYPKIVISHATILFSTQRGRDAILLDTLSCAYLEHTSSEISETDLATYIYSIINKYPVNIDKLNPLQAIQSYRHLSGTQIMNCPLNRKYHLTSSPLERSISCQRICQKKKYIKFTNVDECLILIR